MKTKQRYSLGFTIIEVMLFLAITGLMLAGIMIALAGGINRQQYEDTITSLVDQFQGQYNLVDNVRSNRPDTLVCTTAGVSEGHNSNIGPGSSNCSTVGRLIRSTDNGQTFVSEPVYATADILPAGTNQTESQYVQALGLRTASDQTLIAEDIETYRLPWSGNVYINGNDAQRNFALLILKLPSNGMIRTYSSTVASAPLTDIISSSIQNPVPLRVCVAHGLFTTTGQSVGVRVEPLAANVSGVQRISASDSGDRGC